MIKDGFGGYSSFEDYSYTPVSQRGKESFVLGKSNGNTSLHLKNQFLDKKYNNIAFSSMKHKLKSYHNHLETVISPKIVSMIGKLINNQSDKKIFENACLNDPVSMFSK